VPRYVDLIRPTLPSNYFEKDCGLRPFVAGSTDCLTFVQVIPLTTAICVAVREVWRSFSAAVGRSRVSEAEKNFALEVRRRSRTGKSAKLLTALPLEKHHSTHVISDVLFRIVSDLQTEMKCRFWPIFWFPYDRRIVGSAIYDHMETRIRDSLRSIGTAKNRTMFYSLRSPMIAYDHCDHIETQLRSTAIDTYPIVFIIDPTIQHSIATTPSYFRVLLIARVLQKLDCWQSVFLSKFSRSYEEGRFSVKGNGTRPAFFPTRVWKVKKSPQTVFSRPAFFPIRPPPYCLFAFAMTEHSSKWP